MSYTPEDAMWDEAYEAMSQELYPEHRDQAIEEFTSERLQSYYLKNPEVAVAALGAYEEAQALLKNGHFSACVVFSVTSIEQFLKVSLLRLVVFGLIHTESLADLIVDVAMDKSGGLDRYKKLLAGLFNELADIDLGRVRREASERPVLDEAKDLQDMRNGIVHRGERRLQNRKLHMHWVSLRLFSRKSLLNYSVR